jgi:radical SAM superfamily enzyme YgiQ (UPF0313 family)
MSGVPVWSKDRTKHDPLVVMGGASSFLNPEPIADFTDVIGVGEGEILGPKLVDAILEHETKEEVLLALAQQGRGFYVPSLYEVSYHEDATVAAYVPIVAGVPARVGRAISAENPKEGSCDGRFENSNSISRHSSVVMKFLPRRHHLRAPSRDGRSLSD